MIDLSRNGGGNGLVQAMQARTRMPITQAVRPVERFVMCPPTNLSTRIKNNVWMKNEKIDAARAGRQWNRAKNIIQAFGVEVVEIKPTRCCQDQVYVANVGIALKPYIVLSNFKAPGRDCELEPAEKFFESAGYGNIIQPPYHFEGEADLKKLRDGWYLGGYGQFTDIRAHQWIAAKTGIKIITIKEVNPKLYHLDCSVLVIDPDNVLVTKAGIAPESLKDIERVANVTMAPDEIATTGCTNAVIIPGKKVVLSGTFNPELPDYRKAMELMNAIFDKFGFTCVFLDVDEFDKSGADLSCAIFRLDF